MQYTSNVYTLFEHAVGIAGKYPLVLHFGTFKGPCLKKKSACCTFIWMLPGRGGSKIWFGQHMPLATL